MVLVHGESQYQVARDMCIQKNNALRLVERRSEIIIDCTYYRV